MDAERLRELLHYDPERGVFTWLARTNRRIKQGAVAGCVKDENGYRVIRLDGVLYRSSRLAWLYVHGRWPDPEVDHEDRDPSNDRIGNLREATSLVNKINRRKQSRGRSAAGGAPTSRYRGVCWDKRNSKWIAQISRGKRSGYIGSFVTEEEAARAYDAAAIAAYGDFAHPNFADAS